MCVCASVSDYVYACVLARERVCVRAYVRVCVRACVRARVERNGISLFFQYYVCYASVWILATIQTAKRSFNKQAMLPHHTITCVRGLNIALVPIIYVQCLCLDTRNHTDSEKQDNINNNVPATYSNMCMGYKAETQTPGSMQELRILLHLINYIL
jgi:hypothetical protein